MTDKDWIMVLALADLREGEMRSLQVGDRSIALYNIGGELFATDSICTHESAELTDGLLDSDIVECPLHGGCFNVRTGAGQGDPIEINLAIYSVRVVSDMVKVQIP